jgi:serine-type D-Ala-D-Ala carboxypeptidase/endopeptidase
MNPMTGFLMMTGMLLGAGAPALTDSALTELLEQRLHGDRTGACFAVAVVDETVSRAVVCADAGDTRGIDAHTAFEIGSVTKTMTAVLVAQLIADEKLALDDDLAEHVPDGFKVPSFEGKSITLRHLMTHTSGLPSLPPRMSITSLEDPYARLTEEQLYGSLADVTLSAAPGSRFAYSNFAMMLLSDIVARRAGNPFDTLIAERLFVPLGMSDSFVTKPRKGGQVAVGHLQTGAATSAWHFPRNYAGVGGVRASLDDMVRYVQAQLGSRASAADAAIAMTQKQLEDVQGNRIAMNWMLMPRPKGTVHVHEGGTGGFSSLVAFDRESGRGVVILSDTALTAVGGLGRLGMHLLDGSVPLEKPRRVASPDDALLDGLSGDFVLDGGMRMKVSREKGALVIQAQGQPAFTMGFDSAGDFYPLQFDAILRPKRQADGSYAFTWLQGGGAMNAVRSKPSAALKPAAPIVLRAGQRADYVGDYPLMPGFVLAVIDDQGRLYVQGTGQSRIEVQPVDNDVFVAESVGAEITFERDAAGKVVALVLHQGGQNLRGVRQ